MNIEKAIYHLKEHIVILGYNDRVERIVKELAGEGLQGEKENVLIVSENEYSPIEKDLHVYFLHADPMKVESLAKLQLEKAKVVLVVADQSHPTATDMQIGSIDAQTVLSVITLQRYFAHNLSHAKKRPRVIVECMEENAVEHLKNAGCDEIVMVGSTSAALLAASVINPGITKFFGEVFSTLHGHEFYITCAPPSLHNMSFLQALKHIKVHFGDILVAVKRGHHIRVNPRRYVIREQDQLVVLARFKPSYE